MGHAYAFDTLGYARALEDAGVERRQAEAHATAARTFILAEVATKADIESLSAKIAHTRTSLRSEIKHEILKGVVMICGFVTALAAGLGVVAKILLG
ncbi:CCDC90 family protein [Enterovirga rhinocerotis]|uniref:DUF1640 domain-containing protein n=1 Tax=Enterovirga rhinocerotis TaxID=1339210 RepID=A0A4R7BIQ3_9HYPH|nr:CCDC90 family protein [Enterovirga rhinocerotis]TDR85210.1 hypothetical protein EV668_4755 [Enterovirga rhinocerotis]